MALVKTKYAIKQPIQKAFESRKSGELRGEIEVMRLGMERRKFSYTLHIPERRSGQNGVKPCDHFKTRYRLNLFYVE